MFSFMTIGSLVFVSQGLKAVAYGNFSGAQATFLGAQDKICHNQFRGWCGGGV